MGYFTPILLYYYSIITVLVTLAFKYYQKATNRVCTSTKRLDGKTALVTGGTAGIGLEVAKDFARRGAKVIIACPFLHEGFEAQKLIVEETGNENVVFKMLDLESLKSVRNFADDILKTEDRLDILVNNAGVCLRDEALTEDGLDVTMSINYYGHFLLTILLLPIIKKSGTSSEASRIINMSSAAHWLGSFDPETMNKVGVNKLKYANSKFCMLLFAFELSKRLNRFPVVINSVDPGPSGTHIFKRGGKLFETFMFNWFNFMFKTVREGAQTTLHVALDDRAGKVSGSHFMNCRESLTKPSVYNDKLAAAAWTHSVTAVKLSEQELERCLN